MASKKYYERLLIVAGMFIIFFVIMMMSLSLLKEYLNISQETREGQLILSVVQAFVLFIFPSVLAARVISQRPVAYLELDRPPHWLPVVGLVFAYLMALPALNQIIYWNAHISFPDSIAHWGETLREMEDSAASASERMLNVDSWSGLIVNLIVIGLITAFGEELFFRGTVQRTAASSGAPHTAIWVVALLFSALHMQIFGFVPRLLLGAWFGYLLYWTRSVYVPVLAHFLNNGTVVLCAWLEVRGLEIDFEKLGVVEYGFPLPAFISSLATVVFLVYFRKFFFESGRRNQKTTPSLDYA